MTKEFEKAFISCCLKKPTLVPTMLSGIKADMFDNGECKIIWTIMSELSDKTHKVDVSLFPTMIVGELTKKGLADYVHKLGLKIGLYSSPGPWTCGGCAGSYGFEKQDAEQDENAPPQPWQP